MPQTLGNLGEIIFPLLTIINVYRQCPQTKVIILEDYMGHRITMQNILLRIQTNLKSSIYTSMPS